MNIIRHFICLTLAFPLLAQSTAEIETMIHRGQLDKASTAISALSATAPESPEVDYLNARLSVAKGDPATAVAKLRILTENDPKSAQYHAALGIALVKQAETLPFMERPMIYMESIEFFQLSVALDRNCFEGQIGLANYYLHAPEMAGGSLVKAEQHAREVLRLNEHAGTPLLAQILTRGEQSEAVEAVYRNYTKKHPKSIQGHLWLGEHLASNGQVEAAREEFNRVLELDENHPQAKACLHQMDTPFAE